ncbi:MAG: MBL fold metallo-hydrolase [Pirellulales bacterium]
MNTPTTELWLRVNGIEPAFGIEFGLDNPRAEEGRADPYRQANTSFSLVQQRAGQIVRHTLVDVGMGVVPSLLEFERTCGVHVVHEVVLTHPHFDHFAQLDWLSMALVRNGRPEQPRPLPIYASRACWEHGPSRVLRYVAQRSDFRALEPGVPVTLGDVTLTPFAVEHGPTAPGALGFVVEYGQRKIILTGDCLRVADEDSPLLCGADVCFLDSNTWHPAPGAWHASVQDNLRLVEKWQPKRTYLIHYSGYEDRAYPNDPVNRPLTQAELRAAVRAACPKRDIQPARHGMILGQDTAWPE